MIHELKTDGVAFEAVWQGRKAFELRIDDRGFSVGDLLDLRDKHSTRHIVARVTYSTREPAYGVAPGFVAMGIDVMFRGEMRPGPEPAPLKFAPSGKRVEA